MSFGNLYDVDLSQTSDIRVELGTQDYIRKTLAHINHASVVHQSHLLAVKEEPDWLTPPTSFRIEKTATKETQKPVTMDWSTPHLNDGDGVGRDSPDAPLVYFADEDWKKLDVWSTTFE